MKTLYLFKIIRNTNLWGKGQKVWADWISGDLAAPAIGKYRNRGRWIRAWIHWEDENLPKMRRLFKNYRQLGGKPDSKFIVKCEVSEAFFSFFKSIYNRKKGEQKTISRSGHHFRP